MMIPREVLFVWANAERDRRAGNRILATAAIVLIAAVVGYALGTV